MNALLDYYEQEGEKIIKKKGAVEIIIQPYSEQEKGQKHICKCLPSFNEIINYFYFHKEDFYIDIN